jgi:FkbM family methyltransferase
MSRAAQARSYLREHAVPRLLRHVGVAPAPASRFLLGQRLTLMRELGITCVLDVGANTGQYGRELRAAGYTGRIHSFEPGPEAFGQLERSAAQDPGWVAHPVALGASAGQATLRNWDGAGSESATLREPVAGVTGVLGAYRQETVAVRTLDEMVPELAGVEAARTLLKLDVQGFEREVLRGATHVLPQLAVAEVEAPLVPWYEDQASIAELLETFAGAGFVPASIVTERFHADWLGAPDVDVLLIRRALSRVPG